MILDYLDPSQNIQECAIVSKALSFGRPNGSMPPDCCNSVIPRICIVSGAMSFAIYHWQPMDSLGYTIPSSQALVSQLASNRPVQFSWNSPVSASSSWGHFLVASGYSTTHLRRMRSHIPPKTLFFMIDPEYALYWNPDSTNPIVRTRQFIARWARYATQLVPFSTVMKGYDGLETPGPSAYDFVHDNTSLTADSMSATNRRTIGLHNQRPSDTSRSEQSAGAYPVVILDTIGSKQIHFKPTSHVPVIPINNPTLMVRAIDSSAQAHALATARKALAKLPAYLNATTCKLLGFSSLKQVKSAKILDVPLAHYTVLSRNLDLADTLPSSSDLTFLVEVSGTILSSIRVFRDTVDWKISSYGAAGNAMQVAKQLKISSKQLGIPIQRFFMLNLPELSTELLAVNDPKSGLQIAPLHGDSMLNFLVPISGAHSSPYLSAYMVLANTLKALGK
jgi:hypothetical protein